MFPPFLIVTGLGFLALLAAGWLILRARKPMSIPFPHVPVRKSPPSLDDAKAAMADWASMALKALNYLSTRREWRYQIPWVLLLGEAAAGKTSIAGSVTTGRRQKKLLREQQLEIGGTDWQFFNQGVAIDPAGAFSAAAAGTDEAKRWQKIQGELNDLRPERPLDALVLVVSAATLMQGNADQRQAVADLCYRQLWELQKRFEFAFPVYLIVSQCDTIEGFAAFWNAQPRSRWPEVFGWSNPLLFDGSTAKEWSDAVFDTVGESLKNLQIQAAASAKDIGDADLFFLFPQRFHELKDRLQSFLAVVFQTSAYHEIFYLRGVYFSGSVIAAGGIGDRPRSDVAFVDDLFEKRIFPEKNLARPTRQGIWSRNRLIRRMQVTGICVFIGLCIALTSAGRDLHTQVRSLKGSIETLRESKDNLKHYKGCVSRRVVYGLIENLSGIDTTLLYLSIPASWVDPWSRANVIGIMSNTAFENIILPSMSCQLSVVANGLTISRPAAQEASPGDWEDLGKELRDYVTQVVALEDSLRAFERVRRKGDRENAEEIVRQFAELAQYVYGKPLPDAVNHDRGSYRRALINASFPSSPERPAGMREKIADQIENLANKLSSRLHEKIDSGNELLDSLNSASPLRSRSAAGVLQDAGRFISWLTWVRQGWLQSTEEKNPCKDIETALGKSLIALEDNGYPRRKLNGVLNQFSAQSCYRPAIQRLKKLRVAAYGAIFSTNQDGQLELTPGVAREAQGLAALAKLGFMQVTVPGSFNCSPRITGWRPESLGEATGFIRDYEKFAGTPDTAKDSGARLKKPLYDRLAQEYLNVVLDGIMNDGQIQSDGSAGPRKIGLDLISTADAELSQQSADFARVRDPLLAFLRLYQQYDLGGSQINIAKCARNLAAGALLRVDALAESSQLYDPGSGGSGNSASRQFFALGDGAIVRDYLARQLQRSEVLTGYAVPFVSFLKNTNSVDRVQRTGNQGMSYWDNTVTELNQYAQFKEPNKNQVAYLEGFFMTQFVDMTQDNCAKVLASYRSNRYGNDLFSQRRRALEGQAQQLCSDRRQAEAYMRYRATATRFNRELAGRYPFGDSGGSEAALDTVKAFFLDYAAQRDALRQSILTLNGDRWSQVKRFVDQLDAVAAFLKSNLAVESISQPLKLGVTFRALPRQSPGSEQVVEWLLTIGERSARYPNGQTGIEWSFGQPVLLEMVWASQSKFRPIPDSAQADLQAQAATASFVAVGPWALLRFVEAHRPRYVPAVDPLNPDKVLLEFNVPVAATQPDSRKPAHAISRLYLALALSGVDPKSQAPVPIKFPPVFPRSAPVNW